MVLYFVVRLYPCVFLLISTVEATIRSLRVYFLHLIPLKSLNS
jgi:hypothetical protein